MDIKRKGYKNLEDQISADKRWIENNREHRNYLSSRGAARSFIRNKATIKDLDELISLIEVRRDELIHSLDNLI